MINQSPEAFLTLESVPKLCLGEMSDPKSGIRMVALFWGGHPNANLGGWVGVGFNFGSHPDVGINPDIDNQILIPLGKSQAHSLSQGWGQVTRDHG